MDDFVARDEDVEEELDEEEEASVHVGPNNPFHDDDIEDDGDDSEFLTGAKILEIMKKRGLTGMHHSLTFDAFEQQIWSNSLGAMMRSAFYRAYLRDHLKGFVGNCGHGGSRVVAEFHKKFMSVMEGGRNHMEDVQIRRVLGRYPREDTCDCCHLPRMLSGFWEVTMGAERFIWEFGSVCEGALLRVAAVYNAFRWIERPDDGQQHGGFVFMQCELGVHDFSMHAAPAVKERALAKFRNLLVNLPPDRPTYGKKK